MGGDVGEFDVEMGEGGVGGLFKFKSRRDQNYGWAHLICLEFELELWKKKRMQ